MRVGYPWGGVLSRLQCDDDFVGNIDQVHRVARRCRGCMLIIPPAKSNTQRQREFRQRNPGYYGRLHRRRQAYAVALEQQTMAANVAVSVPAPLLMLPAPVQLPLFPGMIPDAREAELEFVLVDKGELRTLNVQLSTLK